MTRDHLAPGESPLYWIGSSRKDFLSLPEQVQKSMGVALGAVQFGDTPLQAKPWKGDGPGVLEIREDHRGDTLRAIYTVHLSWLSMCFMCFKRSPNEGSRRTEGIGN
jgi:phage-related protein